MSETALPHVGISYEDHVPVEVFDAFKDLVVADGLDLHLEARDRAGPFAGIEWLIPTAVFLFITQSYFAGFLGEMGKDHYGLLKEGVKGLRERFNRVKVTMIATRGKVSAVQPYSMIFSIYFEGMDGNAYKFLVPSAETDTEVGERAMDALFSFLEAYYRDGITAEQAAALAGARSFGGSVLVAFDPDTGLIRLIDPISRSFLSAPSIEEPPRDR